MPLRFPELALDSLVGSVHLVEPDGAVYRGAEAVFRTLAQNPREQRLLDWYQHSALFAKLTEVAYSFAAKHRGLFSFLTRLAWGNEVRPASCVLVRNLFLRGLGIVYLLAFLSLWSQVTGLIGSSGVLPAGVTMQFARQEASAAHLGLGKYHLWPTLCWISASDGFLVFQCAAGVFVALLLIAGVVPVPCLTLLWVLYLSLSTIGREFFAFQWDNLLLEAGLLAIFLAPLRWKLKHDPADPPSRIVVWLFRWLLFRLVLESGLVKLLSGDPAWRNFTAFSSLFQTQPLPTWVSWFAHQLPASMQKPGAVLLLGVELLVPVLVLAPGRLRRIAFAILLALQFFLSAVGNFGFFTLLTALLCLCLLDDATLQPTLEKIGRVLAWRKRIPAFSRWREAAKPGSPSVAGKAPRIRRWPMQVIFPLACIAVVVPLVQFSANAKLTGLWPRPVLSFSRWLGPFRSFNSYGLFAYVTTRRYEIVLEGSNDGTAWFEYEFQWKPGDPLRRPRFAEPHQPRLDWQMWFASLTPGSANPWVYNLCTRLLQGKTEVTRLFRVNPFPYRPPRHIRAVVYEYRFTDWRTRRATGAWWTRQKLGTYLPTMSLQEMMRNSGRR